MKKIIALLFSCIILTIGNANDTTISRPATVNNSVPAADSQAKEPKDEIFENNMKQNERNLDALTRVIRERDRKEMQQMYLRLGLGIFFLIVLIIGILRRKKRKAAK